MDFEIMADHTVVKMEETFKFEWEHFNPIDKNSYKVSYKHLKRATCIGRPGGSTCQVSLSLSAAGSASVFAAFSRFALEPPLRALVRRSTGRPPSPKKSQNTYFRKEIAIRTKLERVSMNSSISNFENRIQNQKVVCISAYMR